MADVVIRPVVPSEFAVAGDLVVEACRSLGDEGDEFYESVLRDVAGRVGTGEVLVAEVEGRVVGCVTYAEGQTELSEVEDAEAATIRMLGVDAEARGQGLGEALVSDCIERARTSGRPRVRLDTRTSMGAAQRLYERLGFRRDPEHDWSPAPGIKLIAYAFDLMNDP